MCLSAHRTYSLGSSSKPLRERGLTIMRRAIEFAAEFGLRIVQVAGYDVFYEESTDTTRGMYLEGILQSRRGLGSCVMLGLENVDCPDCRFRHETFGSSRLLERRGFSFIRRCEPRRNGTRSIRRAACRGRHRRTSPQGRETRGVRRAPFGAGIVDFGAVFRTLSWLAYPDLEMWNDDSGDRSPRLRSLTYGSLKKSPGQHLSIKGRWNHDRTREVPERQGQRDLRDVPVPEIGEDDILLAVKAAGIAGPTFGFSARTRQSFIHQSCSATSSLV